MKIVYRILLWLIILTIITVVGFLITKNSFLYIEQWPQVKYAVLEKFGFKPDHRIALDYLPIADTAFLIPRRQWLKNYSTVSKNQVSLIQLEVSPHILPLSSNVRENESNYFISTNKIIINIESHWRSSDIERFSQPPNSFLSSSVLLIEEHSDQKAQGLQRFRRVFRDHQYSSEEVQDQSKTTDKKFFLNEDGKYYHIDKKHTDYMLIENNRVKYFISCDNIEDVEKERCYLYFQRGKKLMIQIVFVKKLLPNAVDFANKTTERLNEFEVYVKTYQNHFPEMKSPHYTWAWTNSSGKWRDFRSEEPKDSKFVEWVNNL